MSINVSCGAELLEYKRCRKVQEKVWEDGRLVKDQVREVCEVEKVEPRY
jgi:hypothetical protein